MLIYVLFASFVATTYALGDAQLHPIKPEDLRRIVDSVKKDVDRHLKMAYAARQTKPSSLPDLPEIVTVVHYTENGDEYKDFLKMIQDSMEHHLVKNLGQPSDAENDESTIYMKPTPESTNTVFNAESVSEKPAKDSEEIDLESSKASEILVGSVKGVPGVNFPDYTDIPITSFTCSGKPHSPGLYADLDTGCQVFHVCWPERRESFLCPMGTTFNQALGVCDYWYNSNCSLAPNYYTVNAELEPDLSNDSNESVSSMVNTLFENTGSATQGTNSATYSDVTSESAESFVSQFIPIKVKIVVYPKTATQRLKIVTSASIGSGKKSDSKPKPSQKNSDPSKHSRVPRSLKHTKFTKDADIGILMLKRTLYRFYEAFDRAVIDIENDKRWSRLSGYARSAVKDIKSFFAFFIDEPLEDISLEPGSMLFEKDMKMKEIQEGLHELWKYLLILKADLKEKYEVQMKHQHKASRKSQEHKALKPEPLTNLNPRFIVKPATVQTSSAQSPVNRWKRVSIISNPLKLSNGERLNIHPNTKKILLKSYMKLFKIQHKHA